MKNLTIDGMSANDFMLKTKIASAQKISNADTKRRVSDTQFIRWIKWMMESRDKYVDSYGYPISRSDWVVVVARLKDNRNPYIFVFSSRADVDKFLTPKKFKGVWRLGYFARSWRAIIHNGQIVETRNVSSEALTPQKLIVQG